jgi:putative hydrolase of the HAD superfamily
MPISTIRAVTFDVGGTLIEPWPSVGHVYAEVARQHGAGAIAPELLNRRFSQAWKAATAFAHRREDWAALVDTTFAGLTQALPSQSFFGALYDRFAEPRSWRIYDDVLPTLQALSRNGIKLGIISNWDERLRSLLQALKLHDFFEVVVVSYEVGVTKPGALIFRETSLRLGFQPNEVLHVGDSLEMDVRGAEQAGLRALQIHRGKDGGPGSVSNLEDLLSRAYLRSR